VFNAGVAWWNSREQQELENTRASTTRELERQKDERNAGLEASKAEAARILEGLRAADTEKAAGNLRFLVDIGLVSDSDHSIANYLARRRPGEGPLFASPAKIPSGSSAPIPTASKTCDLPVPPSEQNMKQFLPTFSEPPLRLSIFYTTPISVNLGSDQRSEMFPGYYENITMMIEFTSNPNAVGTPARLNKRPCSTSA
jgi:hypothetical protein